MDIFSGVASILGGGITGLIGSVTQRIFEYKTKKLEIELQKEKFNYDIALKKAEAEIQAGHDKAAIEVEDSKAFKTSLENEPKIYHEANLTPRQNWLMVILDVVRGSIRPGLTLYLCILTTIIYFKSVRLLNSDIILPGMAFEIVTQIINTILYTTTTCILWWFGSRNNKK